MLTEQQQKMLVLALDPGAAKGEYENAAVKLISSIRKDKVSGYELIRQLTGRSAQYEDPNSFNGADYGSYVLNFGKHKKQPLRKIPIDYLLWIVNNCQESKPVEVEIIRKFLG